MSEKIVELLRLMEKISNEREHAKKKRIEYAPGVLLSRSERDILDEVGRYPGIGVRGIADNKGVTAGAVSQTVKQLVGYGLLRKAPSPVSEARICIYLTEEGKKSYQISEQRHRESLREWEKMLTRLSENDLDHLTRFLKDMRKKIVET